MKDITKYRDDNGLAMCIDGMENCPCRVFYRKFPLCDFPRMYALWLIARRVDEADQLVERICSPRRSEIIRWRFISKFGQRNAQEFLSKVQTGDRVYCTTELSDVIFLEKDAPPYRWVKYKTSDGEEKIQHPACFRNISQGDKFAEHKVEGDNYKLRVKTIERKARELGFRVEKLKLKEGYLLKIYGDTQENVDEFVALVCNNDFTLNIF